MSTIKDVAKKAGVSMMTVSRVINMPDKVKQDTRKKVELAMEALHFKPNVAAKALATHQTRTIHIFIQSILSTQDPYLMALLAGISEILSASYYSFLIRREWDFPYKSDGVIALSNNEDLTQRLMETIQEPLILFGRTSSPLDYVDFDHYGGTYKMTTYMIEKGHSRIGFLGLDPSDTFAFERRLGYLDAIKAASLPVDTEFMETVVNHTEQAGFESALKLLQNKRMTALVCSSDILALGALTAAKSLHLNVPRDLSIGGFDGLFFDRMATPELTTILQPVHAIGEELAKLLLKRIQDPDKPLSQTIFPAELIERKSVHSPKNEHS
jgi:DNA-binding LacI/PurR family transcriptional regulator